MSISKAYSAKHFFMLCSLNLQRKHSVAIFLYGAVNVATLLIKTSRTLLLGTLEGDGTVLYKTKSLDGTKPNTNPKTNPNPNTNPIQLFYAFFEHRLMIFKLASFVRFFTVPVQYSCRLRQLL